MIRVCCYLCELILFSFIISPLPCLLRSFILPSHVQRFDSFSSLSSSLSVLASSSSGSQQRSAAHLQPRWGSHASGRTWGSRFPPPVSLPQPPHPPPHGDRLHGDLHNRHGNDQQQQQAWWLWPKAPNFPISTRRDQQPHEPDFVPRGVRISLFKSSLFLFLQRSLAASPGRGHGRVIPD